MEKGKFCKNKDKAKSYLKWTKDMNRVITSILVEQHNLENQVPNGWKSIAYTAAINSIKEKCNFVITKGNVVSCFKTWDKHCTIITNMLGTTLVGIGIAIWCRFTTIKFGKIMSRQDRATRDGAETGVEAMKEIE